MPVPGNVATYISQGAILTARQYDFSAVETTSVEKAFINALIQEKIAKDTFEFSDPDVSNAFINQSILPLNDYTGDKINISVDPSNTHVYLHNKSVETPNFFIESSVGPSGIVQEVSFNYIVGNNGPTTFRGFLECINTFQSTVSASMEFIFTQDDSAFDSVDGDHWKATFSTSDPALQLMSMAVNSEINNLSETFSEQSILRAQNYSLNDSFALGKDKNTYNTIDRSGTPLNPPAVTQNYISQNNRLSTNHIDVEIAEEKIDIDDFGTYRFSTNPGSLTIDIPKLSPISPFNTEPHPEDGDTLNDLSNSYFGPIVTSGGNWSFLLTASEESDSGYKLSNPNQTDYVTLDNDAIVNNRAYMNYGYGDATRNTNKIVITQGELLIENAFDEEDEDLNGMELTTMGENLPQEQAAKNGVIILDASGPYQRTTTIGSAPESYTSTYVKYVGDNDDDYRLYHYISDKIKDTRDVSYSIQNILLPTGNSQYNYPHDGNVVANSNGSTLYISNDFETAPDFSSNIKSLYSSNVATYITIANNNALTSYAEAGNQFFNLTSGASFENVDVTVNATGIDISGFGALYQNYRILYKSKTVNDLSLSITDTSFTLYSGLSPTLPNTIGDNKNDVKDSIPISDISFNTSPYLTAQTPITTFSIPPTDTKKYFSQFPSIQEINDVITGSIQSLPVQITYKTENLPEAVNRNGVDVIKDEVLIEWSGGSNRSESYNVVINEVSTAGRNIYKTNYTNPNSETDVNITNNSGASSVSVKKITYTESYDPIIRLPLCGFDNLYLKLSNVTATITYYFSETVDINNGGYVEDADRSIKCKTYKSIVRTGTTSPLSATITLNKSSVTGFLGTLQGKYINAPDSSYTNLAPFQNIDFWYENTTQINNITSSPNASISNRFNPPKKNNDTVIIKDPNYIVPLIFDSANSSYSINGFGYTSAQSFSQANNTNFPFNPDFPKNVQTFSQQPPGFNQILLDASLSLDVNNNVILKVVDRSRQINVATIKTGNTAGFISNMTIFTSNGTYFQVNKSTYTPSEGTYDSPSASSDTYYMPGDDSSSDSFGSSGSLEVDDGIITNYSEIAPGDSIKYMLKPDYVYVNMVDITDGPTVPIRELDYQYEDGDYYSETLMLPHYRGYNFFPAIGPFESGQHPYHANSLGSKQIYIINRKDADAQAKAVWYVDGTVHDSANLGNIYSGKLSDVNYSNVGSIGNLVTFNFSRLATEEEPDFPGGAVTIPIPITVTPDTFTIVSTKSSFNKTGKLTDNSGILFSGVNNFQLLSDRITINSSHNTNGGDIIWKVSYGGSSLSISKSVEPWGEPESLGYSTIHSNLTYEDLNDGYEYNNGHFTVTADDNMRPGTTSYLQISPPQILFTQASIHSVTSLPYTEIDSNKIYQVLLDVNIEDNSYAPFENYDAGDGLNKITFHDEQGDDRKYNEFGDDTDYPFDINGSKLIINEVRVNKTSKWFDGYITELPDYVSDVFDANLDEDTGVYEINYGQFDFIGSSDRNLTFKLKGSFVPTNTYTIPLLPSTTIKVSIVSIHDHIVGTKPGLRIIKLLNTEAVNVDNFATGEDGFEGYVFTPNQYQTFDISYNVSDDLSRLPYNVHKIRHDLSVNSTFTWGDIHNLTEEDTNGFIFILGATDFSGQDIIKNALVFTPDSSAQHHFTYFTAPDIMRVEDPMGDAVYRIAFNGQVYSSTFVSSEIAINTKIDNDATRPSEVIKNSVSYFNAQSYFDEEDEEDEE